MLLQPYVAVLNSSNNVHAVAVLHTNVDLTLKLFQLVVSCRHAGDVLPAQRSQCCCCAQSAHTGPELV